MLVLCQKTAYLNMTDKMLPVTDLYSDSETPGPLLAPKMELLEPPMALGWLECNTAFIQIWQYRALEMTSK